MNRARIKKTKMKKTKNQTAASVRLKTTDRHHIPAEKGQTHKVNAKIAAQGEIKETETETETGIGAETEAETAAAAEVAARKKAANLISAKGQVQVQTTEIAIAPIGQIETETAIVTIAGTGTESAQTLKIRILQAILMTGRILTDGRGMIGINRHRGREVIEMIIGSAIISADNFFRKNFLAEKSYFLFAIKKFKVFQLTKFGEIFFTFGKSIFFRPEKDASPEKTIQAGLETYMYVTQADASHSLSSSPSQHLLHRSLHSPRPRKKLLGKRSPRSLLILIPSPPSR